MNPNKLRKLMQQELEARSQKSIPRAKPEELPKDCKGCGRCCMPHPLVEINQQQYTDYMAHGRELEELRGMTIKHIRHNNGQVLHWICVPACKHLNKKNECNIYDKPQRPKQCIEGQRGEDTCLYMYHINREWTPQKDLKE